MDLDQHIRDIREIDRFADDPLMIEIMRRTVEAYYARRAAVPAVKKQSVRQSKLTAVPANDRGIAS